MKYTIEYASNGYVRAMEIEAANPDKALILAKEKFIKIAEGFCWQVDNKVINSLTGDIVEFAIKK